jgi:hypothetical protein
MKCPVWDHECYGDNCEAWDECGYCKIVKALEMGAYSIRVDSLKPGWY